MNHVAADFDSGDGRFEDFFRTRHIDRQRRKASDASCHIVQVDPDFKCIPAHWMGFRRMSSDLQIRQLEAYWHLPFKMSADRCLHLAFEELPLILPIRIPCNEFGGKVRVDVERLPSSVQAKVEDPCSLKDQGLVQFFSLGQGREDLIEYFRLSTLGVGLIHGTPTSQFSSMFA